jgi:truncated hemoglobin YjbI
MWLPAEPPWHAPDICPDEPGEPSLPSIGRRQRRQLTKILTIVWSAHPPGHSFLRKPRLRRRSGLRGVRVGEAANPGPPAPGTPLHPAIQRHRPCSPQDEPRASRRRVAEPAAPVRCFCPVPGCGHGDAARASGWGSHEAMRHHLDDHCSGTLAGAVPMDYLQAHGLDLCSVCGLLVARRYNGTHPRCRPQSRQQAARRGDNSVADPGLPTLDGIMACDVSTARHVPHVARAAWAQCLARALAAAACSNTMTAWQELLMLPKAVLVAPSRAGARHQRQAALATLRRCQRWLADKRMEL